MAGVECSFAQRDFDGRRQAFRQTLHGRAVDATLYTTTPSYGGLTSAKVMAWTGQHAGARLPSMRRLGRLALSTNGLAGLRPIQDPPRSDG